MSESVTKIVQRPDGGESLRLSTATLTVVDGPDRGQRFTVDRPRLVIGSGAGCDVRLTDGTVSSAHAELVATERGYLLRDRGSTNGTVAGGVLVVEARLVAEVTFSLGGTTLRFSPGGDEIEIPLSSRGAFGELLGQSVAMRQLFAVLERVAPTEATVLLEGPSGTGKELAACGIHDGSPRRERPLVVVDCGAIPAGLIESELFGHERGAFTGADVARRGALQEADGGTLFIDEVGELAPELQPRLLRFLERRHFKPVGADRYVSVDVRVVAATNRDLAAEVQAGRFREDLFYRLSVVRLQLPALRERPEDVRLLAHAFARRIDADSHAIVTADVEAMLLAYDWPGNVRQLRHVIEQLAVVPELARRTLRGQAAAAPPPSIGALTDVTFHEGRKRWQEVFDRQYLAARIEREQGNVSRAAAGAGLARQTLHRLLKRYGLGEG